MLTSTLTRKLSLATAGIGVTLMSFAYAAGVAGATSNTTQISIPVDTVIRSDVGETTELANKDIEDKYQGMVCSVKAVAKNQGSVHPGNNLVVASGSSSVTLEDVERASGVNTEANGELTLSDKVTVSLVMGQDKVFSAGMNVKLTCEEEKTVEICRDGEIVPVKESEVTPNDSETCKEVQVCRDGKIVTVTEDAVNPTDTEKCDDVKICRNGEDITVTEDQIKDGDLEGNCPQTLGTTTQLPQTGAGAIATTLLGVTTALSGAYGFVKNRR